MGVDVDEPGGEVRAVLERRVVELDRSDPAVLDRDPSSRDTILEDEATADDLADPGPYRTAPADVRTGSGSSGTALRTRDSGHSTSN